MRRIKIKGICMAALLLISSPIYSQQQKDTALPVLKVESAVERGLGMDATIAEYTRKIELYQTQQDDNDNLASLAYQTAQINRQQAETNKIYRKDVVAKQVLACYQNIALLQKNLEWMEEKQSYQEKIVRQNEIKLKQGMIDLLTYDKGVKELQNIKEEQEKSIKTLENLRAEFLKMTNLDINKYTLEISEQYVPFELDKSITSYASEKAGELVRYQQKMAELLDSRFWDTYSRAGEGGTGPTVAVYTEGKINVANQLANVENAYKSYKLAIQGAYTAASTALNDLKIKQADYESAERDLRVLDIKYQAGYISPLSYAQQKLQIDQIKIDYLRTVCDYKVKVLQLEKPWAMDGVLL